MRGELESIRQRLSNSADMRRDLDLYYARFAENGTELLRPARDLRDTRKYLIDWAKTDFKTSEVRFTEYRCTDYLPELSGCGSYSPMGRGLLRISKDGRLLSLRDPEDEFVKSFVDTSAIR